MKSSTASAQSDNHSFLQDSSLFTRKPSEQPGQEPLTALPKTEQKMVSPTRPTLAQLDTQGGIRIDLSVPASALILRRLLGKGGFGAVYEGVYQGKSVAIKQLSGHLSSDALIELKREAEIMFQLGISSEHIVKLIKICLETPYSLVMELMPQGSLYDVLRNGQELPWNTRYQIAADSAQGLSDLHERKILHRDLKSLNILLKNGRAKLADFGLAKIKHETGSQSSVTAKGTVLWMAPELFDDEPKVTSASDIYSFGMVLWELVTRQLPYTKAPNPMVAARWIEKGKKEEIPSDCPPAFKKIIDACWETTPAQRPTAIGVLADLKPLAEQKVSAQDDLDSEIKKLKAQMEQMRLAQEQQLRAAAEEKRRLEAEKQTEIERLKQQHQAELKRSQEESKQAQTISPTKPASAPAMSQVIPQTLMPAPKPKVIPEQLELQDQLIVACKQGDAKAVKELFKRGAKPDIANAKGEQPLGAAVWGMCPDVVNALLKEAKGIAPMTWEECEIHNMREYKEVFIVTKFAPQTFDEWNQLLQKMDSNPFVQAFHLKKAEAVWGDVWEGGWLNLKQYVDSRIIENEENNIMPGLWKLRIETEDGYVDYRSQIKQGVVSASRPKLSQEESKLKPPSQTISSPKPMPAMPQVVPQTLMPTPKPKVTPEQLELQDQLIVACKQGDAKAVEELFKRGTKPDIANAKGEQPLGAAVWGMCPDVVNALLKEAKGIAPMSWQECEKHNQKFYQEVFIVSRFAPRTYGEWYELLKKMEPNPFLRALHLKAVDKKWLSTWDKLRFCVARGEIELNGYSLPVSSTEASFRNIRFQIQKRIETAKCPTVGKQYF